MTDKESTQEWEQFQFEVELDLAEDLAALLGEILPGGLVLEKNYGDLFPHELDLYQGPARLIGYYPAEKSEEIQERISRLIESFGQEELLIRIDYSPLEKRNWATAWQERYHPIPIGRSLVVVPTWLDNPYPDRIPIWMDPGMAFGSGTHPTTQICLALLEKSLLDSAPGEMIDLGSGSGILAIGAAKLGVGKVTGLDIDPEAVQIAAQNAEANAVSASVSFWEGSVNELISREGKPYAAPLVVANIITPILEGLFDEGLGDLVLPGGKIILSGILTEQLPRILTCLERAGFTPSERESKEGWMGLIADKSRPQ